MNQGIFIPDALIIDSAPGATPTVDWRRGAKQRLVLDANVTLLSFTPPPIPLNLMLEIYQPAASTYSITAWDALVKWPGGTPPSLTAAVDAEDLASFYWNGSHFKGMFKDNFLL